MESRGEFMNTKFVTVNHIYQVVGFPKIASDEKDSNFLFLAVRSPATNVLCQIKIINLQNGSSLLIKEDNIVLDTIERITDGLYCYCTIDANNDKETHLFYWDGLAQKTVVYYGGKEKRFQEYEVTLTKCKEVCQIYYPKEAKTIYYRYKQGELVIPKEEIDTADLVGCDRKFGYVYHDKKEDKLPTLSLYWAKFPDAPIPTDFTLEHIVGIKLFGYDLVVMQYQPHTDSYVGRIFYIQERWADVSLVELETDYEIDNIMDFMKNPVKCIDTSKETIPYISVVNKVTGQKKDTCLWNGNFVTPIQRQDNKISLQTECMTYLIDV